MGISVLVQQFGVFTSTAGDPQSGNYESTCHEVRQKNKNKTKTVQGSGNSSAQSIPKFPHLTQSMTEILFNSLWESDHHYFFDFIVYQSSFLSLCSRIVISRPHQEYPYLRASTSTVSTFGSSSFRSSNHSPFYLLQGFH